MNQDCRALLSAFHARRVKYLIVGGYARFTKDLELLVKPNNANAQASYAALGDFGAALEGILPEHLAERGCFFRFECDPSGGNILLDRLPHATIGLPRNWLPPDCRTSPTWMQFARLARRWDSGIAIMKTAMRSDLYLKVEVEHEPGEDLNALGAEIARQITKHYSVRSAELSSFTTSDE